MVVVRIRTLLFPHSALLPTLTGGTDGCFLCLQSKIFRILASQSLLDSRLPEYHTKNPLVLLPTNHGGIAWDGRMGFSGGTLFLFILSGSHKKCSGNSRDEVYKDRGSIDAAV